MHYVKIIYKEQPDSVLESVGIENCYLKMLKFDRDAKNISKKEHHHAGFEIHIINNGHQIYKSYGKEYKLEPECFIIIPPGFKHICAHSAKHTTKFSITFNTNEKNKYFSLFSNINKPVFAKVPKEIISSLDFIVNNYKSGGFMSECLVENRFFELIIMLLGFCGFTDISEPENEIGEDVRITMAKQYIKDNIESNPKVSDVASYCYLSEKQLTRLFKISDDITPLTYIQKQKISHIEKLIEDNRSFREISEIMNFSSEYHFNLFFKKYEGMPPGEYRKTRKQ
ncbi:MAG: AraC family transcriptional regulator [Ruminococcaceae bacterium]|nr:AraC family transcriptional regulator [Oscillospiraceae bacterium]